MGWVDSGDDSTNGGSDDGDDDYDGCGIWVMGWRCKWSISGCDPRMLFMSSEERRSNISFWQLLPPVTRLRSLVFLFVVGLNIY